MIDGWFLDCSREAMVEMALFEDFKEGATAKSLVYKEIRSQRLIPRIYSNRLLSNPPFSVGANK